MDVDFMSDADAAEHSCRTITVIHYKTLQCGEEIICDLNPPPIRDERVSLPQRHKHWLKQYIYYLNLNVTGGGVKTQNENLDWVIQ